MNHAHYRIINVPLHKTVIKSCKCYAEYWKELKEKAKPYVPFDYSIEKVFMQMTIYYIISVLIVYMK